MGKQNNMFQTGYKPRSPWYSANQASHRLFSTSSLSLYNKAKTAPEKSSL